MYLVNIDKPTKMFTVHVDTCQNAGVRGKAAGTGYWLGVADPDAVRLVYQDMRPDLTFHEAPCMNQKDVAPAP